MSEPSGRGTGDAGREANPDRDSYDSRVTAQLPKPILEELVAATKHDDAAMPAPRLSSSPSRSRVVVGVLVGLILLVLAAIGAVVRHVL